MRIVVAAGFAVVLTGCSVGSEFAGAKPAEGAPPELDTSEASAPGPEIGTIKSWDGTVTVYASEAGPLFTIADNDGNVEAEGISYVELEDRYPDHYRALRNSIANDGRLWAGYERALEAGGSIKFRTLEEGEVEERAPQKVAPAR